jgi:hypothetical protein
MDNFLGKTIWEEQFLKLLTWKEGLACLRMGRWWWNPLVSLLFFCGTGVWIQAYTLIHSTSLLFVICFLFSPDWLWTSILFISVYGVARITDVCHQCLATLLKIVSRLHRKCMDKNPHLVNFLSQIEYTKDKKKCVDFLHYSENKNTLLIWFMVEK